jgi:ABC-type antimicrobial peptide transport system permease subunit
VLLTLGLGIGARRRQVTATIFGEGRLVTAAGLAAGGVAATGLSQLLTGVVPGSPPVSTPVLGLVAVVFAGAALAAYVPTRRATAIAAVDALRHE